MAKQKKQLAPQNIVCECCKCSNSIERDNKLHCKVKILDLNKPFSSYSEVKTKIDCNYFGVIK
jgi:hypothetical protein